MFIFPNLFKLKKGNEMKHIKPVSAKTKALDWGLNSGLGGIAVIIQALVTLLTAIGSIKGTGTNSTSS